MKLRRSDPADRRDCPSQDVIAAPELLAPLNHRDVLGTFDHTEQALLSLGITADGALFARGDVETTGTDPNCSRMSTMAVERRRASAFSTPRR